ncbi:hypothetical protein E4T43_08777 [Aureobasidium subglaciale]|nr:hypothetical protein E4T43_08777 [Aureobasidium subglaciale]
MDPDTSIPTDSPGVKAARTQLKWTNDMESAFIATMKGMQGAPTKTVPSGFTKEAYKRVAEIMKARSMQPDLCDDVRMKNKLGALRNDWRTYVNLLNTGWSRLPNGVPTNTDEMLETYYKEQDPNARKFRAAPLRHFAELTDLFDPNQEESSNSPSTARSLIPNARQSVQLPQSPYESAMPQLQDHLPTQSREESTSLTSEHLNHSHPYTPHTSLSSVKRPAEASLSNQAKRILLGESPPSQPRPSDTLRAYYGNTSQISPVAAATALFQSTFSSLPVMQRVAAVKRFQDQNLADVFLHTDAEATLITRTILEFDNSTPMAFTSAYRYRGDDLPLSPASCESDCRCTARTPLHTDAKV